MPAAVKQEETKYNPVCVACQFPPRLMRNAQKKSEEYGGEQVGLVQPPLCRKYSTRLVKNLVQLYSETPAKFSGSQQPTMK